MFVFVTANHIGIFNAAGYEVRKFRYWNEKTYGVDFDSMMKALNVSLLFRYYKQLANFLTSAIYVRVGDVFIA